MKKEFIDYYGKLSELSEKDVDPTWSCPDIDDLLTDLRSAWKEKQSNTDINNVRSHELINDMLKLLNKAGKILTKKNKKEEYDIQWRELKNSGEINTKKNADISEDIERAKQLLINMNSEEAFAFAGNISREAINKNPDDIRGYTLLAKSYAYSNDRKQFAIPLLIEALDRFKDPHSKHMLLERIAKYGCELVGDHNSAQWAISELKSIDEALASRYQALLYLEQKRYVEFDYEIGDYLVSHSNVEHYLQELYESVMKYVKITFLDEISAPIEKLAYDNKLLDKYQPASVEKTYATIEELKNAVSKTIYDLQIGVIAVMQNFYPIGDYQDWDKMFLSSRQLLSDLDEVANSSKHNQITVIMLCLLFNVTGLHRVITGKKGGCMQGLFLVLTAIGFAGLYPLILFIVPNILLFITDIIAVCSGKYKDGKGKYVNSLKLPIVEQRTAKTLMNYLNCAAAMGLKNV